MATPPVIVNLCQCSSNIPPYKPCHPQIGSNCIQSYKCATSDPLTNISFGCTSFDNVAIERRIQNQSRMFESVYKDALKDITVAQDRLSFKGTVQNFENMSSRVWGNPNYLRNQSDRSTPSRSGAFINHSQRQPAFGVNVGVPQLNIPGYVNVPSRGNSTRSTITGNRPGAMTPGGQGVDVKHGSYDRYLARKKGTILTKPSVNVTSTPALPIAGKNNMFGYRRGFRDSPKTTKVVDSASINNMVYKFTPVNLNITSNKQNCWDCSLSIFNPNS